MNSRAKGAAAEREAAKEWARLMGCDARRGQQFSGGKDSPDVVHSAGAIHLEVKRTERGNPYDWVDQAVRDCGGKIPLVLHRRNGREWLAIVRLNDVPGLSQELSAAVPCLGGGSIPPAIPSQDLPTATIQDGGGAGVFRHVGGPG